MVAVPGEVNQLGIIGLTGATYTGHTISPWDKCCFRFCNSGNIPRKMLDCGMIVPRFPFIDVGWYQLRGFNDVDNNLDVLKKHYAMGVYGTLKFEFVTHTITLQDFEDIVDAIVSKKGTNNFADLSKEYQS